jgi:hypothetical protein
MALVDQQGVCHLQVSAAPTDDAAESAALLERKRILGEMEALQEQAAQISRQSTSKKEYEDRVQPLQAQHSTLTGQYKKTYEGVAKLAPALIAQHLFNTTTAAATRATSDLGAYRAAYAHASAEHSASHARLAPDEEFIPYLLHVIGRRPWPEAHFHIMAELQASEPKCHQCAYRAGHGKLLMRVADGDQDVQPRPHGAGASATSARGPALRRWVSPELLRDFECVNGALDAPDKPLAVGAPLLDGEHVLVWAQVAGHPAWPARAPIT